jgi:DNA-binding transcriptional LysR family regulator
MELRRLRLLHELSRRGTVAGVAEALSFSPSSVSAQLAELEREAGVELLQRVGRNVRLTPAGWRLVEHADQALGADEAVRAELAALSGAPRGRLRLTFVQTPALALLSRALVLLAESAPDLRVEVLHSETAPALDALRARAVDLVVGSDYDVVPIARHRDIHRQDLIREAVLLVVAAGHPLADRRTISLGAVEHVPWAAGHRSTGHGLVVDHICGQMGGFAPDIRHRTDDGLILGALAASGRAVTVLPALVTGSVPQVAARPIAEGTIRRTIFTAARASGADAPAVVAVRSALRSAAAEVVGSRRDLDLA